MNHAHIPPALPRRTLLSGGLALLLAACGGGGGGDAAGDPGAGGGPGQGGGVAGPTGRLAFSNGSKACLWNFADGSHTTFDLGSMPSVADGISVSPAGIVILPREVDNDFIGMDVLDLTGQLIQGYRLARTLAFYTSPIMFDGAGARIAFSLNEQFTPDGDRMDRTLVFSWPDGQLLATLDGVENPEWIDATGELVVRDAPTKALRLFDANLRDLGPLAGLTVRSFNSSFSLSRDGRFVLMEDGPRIQAYDRTTGATWVAAERISDMHAPRLAPDGRWLVFHAIDVTTASPQFHTYVPHIVPFSPGATVQVVADTPRLSTPLAFTGYAMDWLA
jgi:hypothetical protein